LITVFAVAFMQQLELSHSGFSKILNRKGVDIAMKKIIYQIILEVVKEIVRYFFND